MGLVFPATRTDTTAAHGPLGGVYYPRPPWPNGHN